MENFVKSAKFVDGKLIIVNEKDETISLDFNKVASSSAMNTIINAVKEIGKACSSNVESIEEVKKSLKDISLQRKKNNVGLEEENSEVVHKSGNEAISGTKYFRRLKISEFNSGAYNGASMSFSSLGNKNDYINIYSDSGLVTLHVQRNPIEPLEVATKEYVDNLVGTNQGERIEKLEREIEALKGIIQQLKNRN